MSKTERNSETLAAIATPLGEGGIGVIQVSGPHSLEIVGRLFKGKRVKDITKVPSGGLFYGTLEACSEPFGSELRAELHSESNSSGTVDEVVVNVWRAGDSPTGEDMVEVNCHGGIRAIRRTLEAILAAGAKEARWPELLDQALKKGRLDLIQKEALEALTQAKTRLCVKVLLWQYQGALSRAISTLEARLKALEEGIGAPSEETHRGLSELLAGIERLLDSSTFGLALTCPQKVTIAGVPNVGKSTLFNLLLREERAIVHPEPGTTRDYVSEYLSIRGVPFELVDSAGVRNAQVQVEREGVERARALHKQADKIILVLDNSRPLSQEERLLIDELDPKRVVPVINKIDLENRLDLVGASALGGPVPLLEGRFLIPPVRLSALHGQGLEALETALIKEFQEELGRVGARCNVPPACHAPSSEPSGSKASTVSSAEPLRAELQSESSGTNPPDLVGASALGGPVPIVFTPRQRQALSDVMDRVKGLLESPVACRGTLQRTPTSGTKELFMKDLGHIRDALRNDLLGLGSPRATDS